MYNLGGIIMLTYNSKNDIAAIGYSTGEAFMTVHEIGRASGRERV